ncbi:MAG: CorB [Pseudomonadota bacterium]|jgi:cytochrome c peroxidase
MKPVIAYAAHACPQRLNQPQLHLLLITALCCLPASTGWALQLDHPAPSLHKLTPPVTPGLFDGPDAIIVNPASALILGKSLFWDTALGSDGMACASCHFHAGSDRRTINQLTGTGHISITDTADHPLKKQDYPFTRFSDSGNRLSTLTFSTATSTVSSGTWKARFDRTRTEATGEEYCLPQPQPDTRQGTTTQRQTGSRNAPTVINAAFNYRNFWDGRASHLFNGATPYGAADPTAGVWIREHGSTHKVPLALPNASLASQAVAPPLDSREMSCEGRNFADLARKLLGRRPLSNQQVDQEDSVLGTHRHPSGLGLDTRYDALIRQSFAPRFWSDTADIGQPDTPESGLTQIEANFAFFLGLTIQVYEATLISDQTPFDAPRGADGFPEGFTPQQKRGHIIFDKAECDFCHRGPAFTLASHPYVSGDSAIGTPLKLIDRRVISIDERLHKPSIAMIDSGFANTSVTPAEQDIGLGALNPFGQPLAMAEIYQQSLMQADMRHPKDLADAASLFSLGFTVDFRKDELLDSKIPRPEIARSEMAKEEQGRLAIAARGAFKIPTLRNIELTGPYMHNGSMKNLQEVIEFYDRGGNLDNPGHFGTFVFQQHFTTEEKEDLLAFLLTLTDERVRWERAPFDHPAIDIPHGSTATSWLHIPAVGRRGRSTQLGPLKPFSDYLD